LARDWRKTSDKLEVGGCILIIVGIATVVVLGYGYASWCVYQAIVTQILTGGEFWGAALGFLGVYIGLTGGILFFLGHSIKTWRED